LSYRGIIIKMIPNYKTYYSQYANQTLYWLRVDTKERYEKNLLEKRHLLEKNNWIDKSFTYKFNSHGFRSDEFTEKPTIMFLGCSLTFGMGIPVENTWCSLIAEELKLIPANLGISGSSADTAFRLCHGYIDLIKPKIIVFINPPEIRTEYFNNEEWPENLGIWYNKDSEIFVKWSLDENNNYFQMQKNILGIKAMCYERGIKFVYGDQKLIPRIDLARDLLHPGIESNKKFAKIILKKIN